MLKLGNGQLEQVNDFVYLKAISPINKMDLSTDISRTESLKHQQLSANLEEYGDKNISLTTKARLYESTVFLYGS